MDPQKKKERKKVHFIFFTKLDASLHEKNTIHTSTDRRYEQVEERRRGNRRDGRDIEIRGKLMSSIWIYGPEASVFQAVHVEWSGIRSCCCVSLIPPPPHSLTLAPAHHNDKQWHNLFAGTPTPLLFICNAPSWLLTLRAQTAHQKKHVSHQTSFQMPCTLPVCERQPVQTAEEEIWAQPLRVKWGIWTDSPVGHTGWNNHYTPHGDNHLTQRQRRLLKPELSNRSHTAIISSTFLPLDLQQLHNPVTIWTCHLFSLIRTENHSKYRD